MIYHLKVSYYVYMSICSTGSLGGFISHPWRLAKRLELMMRSDGDRDASGTDYPYLDP